MPFKMMINHFAGTILLISCKGKGILDTGKIKPDNNIVGSIKAINEIIIAVCCDAEMVEIKIPNDNKNLGVHEFAHALSFNVLIERTYENRNFRKNMEQLSVLYNSTSFQNKLNNSAYFRDYSKTNIHEFFAVVVENYVETPLEFRQQFPELFRLIRSMLNFDFAKPFVA